MSIIFSPDTSDYDTAEMVVWRLCDGDQYYYIDGFTSGTVYLYSDGRIIFDRGGSKFGPERLNSTEASRALNALRRLYM